MSHPTHIGMRALICALDEDQVEPIFRHADVTFLPTSIMFKWGDENDIDVEISPIVKYAAGIDMTVRVGREPRFFVALDFEGESPSPTK